MKGIQQVLQFDSPPPFTPASKPVPPRTQQPLLEHPSSASPALIASGEKAKARDILAAIRTLKSIEQEQRPATREERQALVRFGGFGPARLLLTMCSPKEPDHELQATRMPAGRPSARS